MANVGDLTVELDLDTKDFTRNMQKAQSQMSGLGKNINGGVKGAFSGFSGQLKGLSGQLGNIGGMFAGGLGMGVAAGAVGILTSALTGLKDITVEIMKQGVKYNSMLEQGSASFKTLTGSAEIAGSLMSDLVEFEKRTPFDIDGTIEAAKMLKTFGFETNEIIPTLETLGDVSQGNTEKLKGLALVLSQVRGQTKMNTVDFYQFINNGFNPLEEIARKTGKTMGELREKMENGAISIELVELALKSATSEGGKFYSAMNNQSDTFQGKMDKLGATMDSLKGRLSAPFFNLLNSGVLPALQVALDNLNDSIGRTPFDVGIGKYRKPMPTSGITQSKEGFQITGKGLKDLSTGFAGLDKITNTTTKSTDKLDQTGKNMNDMLSKGTTTTTKAVKASSGLTDSINQQANAFENFANIFDKVTQTRVSAKSLFQRLKGQVIQMRKWRDNLAIIGERIGKKSPLFQELLEQGPARAGEIAALSSMSPAMMKQYAGMYGEKTSIASNAARGNIVVNVTGNNIGNAMDADIVASKMTKKLNAIGVR